MNEDKILGKKIFIITAHPDDETFTTAGTIYRNNKMGGSTFAVCATLGEKGKSHLETDCSEKELAQIRKQELIGVLEFLGVRSDDIHTFNFPDASVNNYSDSLENKILPLVRKASPDLIISFDECGITGHEDHIAIGKVARKIANALKLPLATFTLPPELLEDNPTLFRKQRKYGKYEDSIKFKEPNVIISIDKVVKVKALCFHKSQFGKEDPLRDFPSSVAECVLSKEYFSLK